MDVLVEHIFGPYLCFNKLPKLNPGLQFLIILSLCYIPKGKSLARSRYKQSLSFAVSEWLFTRILAALLWPFHLLGKKLVYSKIHSALGITKVSLNLLI